MLHPPMMLWVVGHLKCRHRKQGPMYSLNPGWKKGDYMLYGVTPHSMNSGWWHITWIHTEIHEESLNKFTISLLNQMWRHPDVIFYELRQSSLSPGWIHIKWTQTDISEDILNKICADIVKKLYMKSVCAWVSWWWGHFNWVQHLHSLASLKQFIFAQADFSEFIVK